LLLGILGLTATVLVVAALVSAVALRAYLLGRIDSQLRGAAGLVQARGGHLIESTGPGQEQRTVIAPTDYLVEVRDPAGTITRLSGARPVPTAPLLDQLRAATADPVTLESGSGRFRVDVAGATVLVGLPLAPVEETVRQLVLIEALSAVALLIVLAILARLLVVRRLRPLEDITATATAISAARVRR
jgi:two-component system OmpR family sensor kinase